MRTPVLNFFISIGLVSLFLGQASSAGQKPSEIRVPIELFSVPRLPLLHSNPTGFQMVSDPDTRIATLIVQTPYPEDPFLFDLLPNLRNDVKVVCIVRGEEYAHKLWANLHRLKIKFSPHQLRFVVTNKSARISRWGRDPYTVLVNPATQQFILVSAFMKDSKRANNWEDRYIRTAIVGADFGMPELINGEVDRIPTWLVEGGSITADKKNFYIGKGSVLISAENDEGKQILSTHTVLQSISDVSGGKKPIVLPAADLHSDRFHIPVGKTKFGEQTSLLSDPVKALEIIASLTEDEKKQALKTIQSYGLKWNDQEFIDSQEGVNLMARHLSKLNENSLEKFLHVTQDEIEKIRQSLNTARRNEAAALLEENGVTVVRLPVLNKRYLVNTIVGDAEQEQEELETIEFPITLTYTNIIQDCSGKKKTVYIPKYGIKKLDDYVYNVYKSLGRFDKIVQVRAVHEAVGDGGLRCRVQVLGYPTD